MEREGRGDLEENTSQNFWALVQPDDGQHPVSLPVMPVRRSIVEAPKPSSLEQGQCVSSSCCWSLRQQVEKERLCSELTHQGDDEGEDMQQPMQDLGRAFGFFSEDTVHQQSLWEVRERCKS